MFIVRHVFENHQGVLVTTIINSLVSQWIRYSQMTCFTS